MALPNYDKQKFQIVLTVCENCHKIDIISLDGAQPSYQEIIGVLEVTKQRYIFDQTVVNIDEYLKWKQAKDKIVEWLDESGQSQPGGEEWISVDDRLPTEGGRYWCYVEEITDLGHGYFQWNCAYNQNGRLFTDKSLCNGERITHWRPLPEAPKSEG